MKKILFSLLTAAALTLPVATAEGGVDFSGEVETLWGAGAPWADGDSTAGRFLLGDVSFTGSIDAYYDNSSAYAEGTVGYDATSGGFYANLGELWLDYSSSFWGLRIGRQKAAWGKADGVDITNVLCPSDMSSFSAMMADDGSLAVDALRLSVNGGSFTADAWWIPFFTPASLPLDEGNTLRKFLVPSSVDFPVAAMNTTLTLPVAIGELSTPEKALWNGEYGLKLSGYFSALDVSLYGFYGWDDIPLLDYTLTNKDGAELDLTDPAAMAGLGGISVSGAYKRMGMIGADAAVPIGETVLRAEAAFFPRRSFQKSASAILKEETEAAQSGKKYSTSEKHEELSALVGIDWMPDGWTLTAQYFCDAVFGNLENLEREDAYTHGATVSVSKTFLNETLEASLAGMVNFAAFDSLVSPSLTYSLSDQISLGGGAYLFIPGPKEDGEYGAYKDLSCLYVTAKFSF